MISRKTGIKRTTLYGMLDELKKQGIVYEVVKNDTKYFSVISPDTLCKQLEKRYTEFKESLPSLMTLMGKFGDRPRITFYEGREQVENMLYEHNSMRVKSMANYDCTWR
jgi:sugar-specific transcriptional regulator TrmB